MLVAGRRSVDPRITPSHCTGNSGNRYEKSARGCSWRVVDPWTHGSLLLTAQTTLEIGMMRVRCAARIPLIIPAWLKGEMRFAPGGGACGGFTGFAHQVVRATGRGGTPAGIRAPAGRGSPLRKNADGPLPYVHPSAVPAAPRRLVPRRPARLPSAAVSQVQRRASNERTLPRDCEEGSASTTSIDPRSLPLPSPQIFQFTPKTGTSGTLVMGCTPPSPPPVSE
jgi:hypothetical protein